MATFGQQFTRTMQAASDLSTLSDATRYIFLRATGAGNTCTFSSGGNMGSAANLVGVLQNLPNSGEHVTVAFLGQGKLSLGATIGANVWVTSNGSGRGAVAGSGDIVGAFTLEAGADGDVVSVVYLPPFGLAGTV